MKLIKTWFFKDEVCRGVSYEDCAKICIDDNAILRDKFFTDDGFYYEKWYSDESNTCYVITND
jgi:hypothetical protein